MVDSYDWRESCSDHPIVFSLAERTPGWSHKMHTVPVTEILDANQVLATLFAFKKGDFSVRLPVNQVGLAGKIADVLNDIFELNENMANELRRVSTAVGKEGRIGQRAALSSGSGDWNSCVESV